MDLLASLSAALSGRYEILRELGSGGMATVYLAEDVKPARELAVSVLRAELAAILGRLERPVHLGFFSYPVLAERDPLLEEIRGTGEFRQLMEKVKRIWEAFPEPAYSMR